MADRRPGSHGDDGEAELWATRGMVERYHLENKQAHKELDSNIFDMAERVQKAEFWIEQAKEKFNNGAATMTLHGDRIGKLEEFKRPKWSTVIAAGLVIGGWIWMFSRYPDPQRFEALREQVQEMKSDQASMKRDIADVAKSQDEIEKKLDRVLATP